MLASSKDKVKPSNATSTKMVAENNLESAPTSKMTAVARTRDGRRAALVSRTVACSDALPDYAGNAFDGHA